MKEELKKIELMLNGVKEMNLNSVYSWFPKVNKEELIEAIKDSKKFAVENDMISLIEKSPNTIWSVN